MASQAQRTRQKELMVLRGCLFTATAALALVLLVMLMGWLSVEREVTVERLEWERSVEVQRRVIESGWVLPEDPLPAGAREIGREQRVIGTKEVVVGQKTVREMVPVDEVTGTTRKYKGLQEGADGELEPIWVDEPKTRHSLQPVEHTEAVTETVEVTAEVVLWEARRWRTVTALRASGSSEPRWPEAELESNERLGSRSEHYHAVLKAADEDIFAVSLDPERAMSFQPGSTHKIRRTLLGKITELDGEAYRPR